MDNASTHNQGYLELDSVMKLLGGLKHKGKKNIYTLCNNKKVVVRNNATSISNPCHYWYNIQKLLFDYDIDYFVCVVGLYGLYCIPFGIIKEHALNGDFSVTENGKNYKIVLKKINEQMHLTFVTNRLSNERKSPLLIGNYFYDAQPKSKYKKLAKFNITLFPDSAGTETCIEGAKTTVQVNKYERSSIARQKCIDVNGCYCHICGLNFTERYGEVGKDFIHVHHKIPLNEISEKYVVNPANDLIPVCPNCHAMLHRKINDKYLSIDELKAILQK